MIKNIICLTLIGVAVKAYTPPPNRADYAGNVYLKCFKDANTQFNVTATSTIDFAAQGCPANGNLSFVFPAFTMNYAQFHNIITNLLQSSGGCVCFVDYTHYTYKFNKIDYFEIANTDTLPIAKVVTDMLVKIGNYERMFFFGHSLGSRVAIEVGVRLNGQVGRMDLCDPSGPAYIGNPVLYRNPRLGAKHTQCIHTSYFLGPANDHSCHRTWRMGICGYYQPGATYVMTDMDALSHNMCMIYYELAFTVNYVPTSSGLSCMYFGGNFAKHPACAGSRMGYLDRTDNAATCYGHLFVETTSKTPYKK